VTLYGHGECELQLCTCLEFRETSLVWDVAAQCGTPAARVDMVLTFRKRDESFVPDTSDETSFAKVMKTLIAKGRDAYIWERIGFKLGTVKVPIALLHVSALTDPGQCRNDMTRLLTSGTAVVGSVEFRTFLPVGELNRLTAKHQLVAPVLTSMVEDFQDYRSANVTHCDRYPRHITLGRAPSRGGAPVAQIIDTDQIKQGFDVRRMAHWFGAMTYNVCKLDGRGKPLEVQLFGGWSPQCSSSFDGGALQWLKIQLLEVERGAESDGVCVGMRELVSRVVKPAFKVAMGIREAPADWWAAKLNMWVARFYPSSSHTLKDFDAVFTEARFNDRRPWMS